MVMYFWFKNINFWCLFHRARLVARKLVVLAVSAEIYEVLAEVAVLVDSADSRKNILKIYFIDKIKKKLYVKIAKMVIYNNFSQYSQKSNSNLTFSAYYTIQHAKVKITCLVKKLADKPNKPKKGVFKRAHNLIIFSILQFKLPL
ncbi:unnamed protein product [Cuscuta epithymum]|uniref:Uncharacterized protein n=1 Tax=Cuscuta epithymum TaxID=186058 RepID=A0AAV0GI46_9ASTE|nr:unnamed protein product [Cuscuta epithymum]